MKREIEGDGQEIVGADIARMPLGRSYDWVLLKVDVKGLDIAADG